MAFPDPVTVRRARRRRRLTAIVVLIVVFSVVALALRYRSERRQAVDYVAVAESVALEHQSLATSMTDLLKELNDFERPEILTRLETIDARARTAARTLDAAPVPGTVAEAHGYLTVALESWARSAEMLPGAVVTVLDEPENERNGDALVENAFLQLRIGDAAYARFLDALAQLDGDIVTRSFPEVAYVGDQTPLYDGPVIAERLRSIRKLGDNKDIAITFTTVPEASGERTGFKVIPNTGNFTVLVVVTNVGNSPAEAVDIAVSIEKASTNAEPFVVRELIPVLEPGQARTIEFARLEVEPGLLYELQIAATLAEDADLDNNVRTLNFVVNEES